MSKPNRSTLFLKGVFASLVLLAVLEALARLIGTLSTDLQAPEDWYVYRRQLGWRLKPGFKGEALFAFRQFDSQGFLSCDSAQARDKQRPKILAIGDSCTFGNAVDMSATYAEELDRLLPRADVINMGVPGYTSFQGYKLLKTRGLELDPSLVIVAFNFNDRRYVLREEDVDSDAKLVRVGKRRPYKALDDFFRNLHLYRFTRFVLAKFGIVRDRRRLGDLKTADLLNVDVSKLQPRVSPEQYRSNLSRIVEITRERDIPVIFLLLKDNPVRTESLKTGLDFLEKAQYEKAIEHLTLAVELENYFSELARVHLARAYRQTGDHEKAKSVAVVPFAAHSLHGGYPIRLDSEYTEIMREVARESGAPVVDAGALLDETPAMYFDFCHFGKLAHKKIGRLLFERIETMEWRR